MRIFLCVNRLYKCLPLCGVNVVLAPRNGESEQKICFNRDSSLCMSLILFFFFCNVFIDAVYRYLTEYFDCISHGYSSRVSAIKDCSFFTCKHKLYF